MLVGTKDLRSAIGAVGPAISRRVGIPALGGVRLVAEPGRLELAATDLELAVTVELEAEVEVESEQWSALVPAAMLKDAAKAYKGERFSIRPDGAGNVVLNGAGSARCLPLEDWPALAEPGAVVGTFDAARFRSLVESVTAASSSDEARPVLTGALLELDGERVTMAATDSYRLHVGALVGASASGRAIVPARALRAISKAIGKRGAGMVVVRAGKVDGEYLEGPFTFELRITGPIGLGPATYSSRTIDGEFPNWRQLVPDRGAEGTGRLHYEPAAMLAALEAVGPYCGASSPARFTFTAGPVRISASSPDLGTYAGDLDGADWEGDDISAAFNPAYLAGAVRSLEGADGPVMYIRDGLKPAMLRASGDGLARVALVMPVRLPAAVDVGPLAHKPAEPVASEPEPEPEPEPVADDAPAISEREPEPETDEPEPARDLEPGEPLANGGADHRPVVRIAEAAERIAEAEAQVAELERANGNGHGPEPAPVVDRTALVAKLREGESSSGSDEWAELVDVGEAGGVRVRLVAGPDGKPRVDARRFVSSKRYNGPTRKGFALEPDAAAIVAGLLLDAAAAAAEVGAPV